MEENHQIRAQVRYKVTAAGTAQCVRGGLHLCRSAARRRHHPVRLPGLGRGQQPRLLHRGSAHLRRLLLPACRAHWGVPGKYI